MKFARPQPTMVGREISDSQRMSEEAFANRLVGAIEIKRAGGVPKLSIWRVWMKLMF
jgi:hypothetical protein